MITKNLFKLLSITLFICACSTVDHGGSVNAKRKDINGLYDQANELACAMRFKNNEKYCKCHVEIMGQITPEATKHLLVNGGGDKAVSEMTKVMINNSSQLKTCDPLMQANLDIPDSPHSKALLDILEKHRGDILYPEDVAKIDVTDIKNGFEYKMQDITPNKNGSLDPPEVYRFSKVVDNAAYFSILNEQGAIEKPDFLMWKDGVMHTKSSSEESYRSYHSDAKCQFVVGTCTYESVKESKTINSIFKSGVWIRSAPGLGFSRRLVKEVYDKNGMLLYRLNATNYRKPEMVRI
ncbi:MAG: hypothetical protein RL497_1811 [Pseudomonadota bacterium]|jgi:hypothetical protein